MTSSRPPAATPERRQSRIFSTLGFTPRVKSFSPSSPALNVTQKRLLDAARRNEREDLGELLTCLESADRNKAMPVLSLYINTCVLENAEILAILEAMLRLLRSYQVETLACGFQLLHELLRQQKVPQSFRVDLANDIMALENDHHLLQKPQCLADVTDDGKNIDGLEHSVLRHTCSVASSCFDRYMKPGDDDESSLKETWRAAFLQSIRLLSNTIRFGRSIDTSCHCQVIDEVRRMIRDVDTSEELLELLKVFDAFVFRGELPESSLMPVIKTLCNLHAKRSQERDTKVLEKTIETLQWLCQIHAQSTLVSKMVFILHDSHDPPPEDSLLATGSLQLLIEMLSDPLLSKDLEVELDDVLSFLQQAQFDEQPKLLWSASLFFCVLVEKSDLVERLVSVTDWEDLSRALLSVYLALIRRPDNGSSFGRAELEIAIRKIEEMDRISPQQRYHLAQLGLHIGQHLPFDLAEKLLSNYERPLDPTEMHEELDLLCKNYIEPSSVAPQLQLMASEIVQKLVLGLQQSEAELARQCITSILNALSTGNLDTHIQSRLVGIVIEYIATSTEIDDDLFFGMIVQLSFAVRAYHKAADPTHPRKRTARPIALALVLLFMRCINVSADRSQFLMKTMMDLLTGGETDPSAAVMLLRATFRLRSDISYRIFLVASPEGEGLAATLSRASNVQVEHARRASKASSIAENGPAWKYGEIQGLPEDPPSTASKVLSSIASPSEGANSLNMAAWLAYASSVIENGADWEIFSYTIVHLGAQLTNQTLFVEAIPQLRELRSLLCRQLLRQTVLKPPEHTDLRQSDVAVCLYHVLTMIIGYHEHFSRAEKEELISAFIMGLTAWDRTTVPCIHALTLCCYELPDFLKRDLVRIVSQMATIVTKSEATVHVLEFLAGLSRITDLARTFRGEEIKVVFGVCFSYVDYVRARRLDESQQRTKTASMRSTDRPVEAPAVAEDVGEYVFALAYHVILFWSQTLQRGDREQYYSWMQQRLLSTDAQGKREVQALVTLDFVWRTTRRPQTEPSLLAPDAPTKSATSVISQYSLMTLEREGEAKTARVIDRRASGTDEWIIDAPSDMSDADLLASQFLKESENPFPDATAPVPFEITDAALRTMGMFDRTSPVDFFKAGVLFVGEDQYDEASILSNTRGSPKYIQMLGGLGSRLHLLGLRHNTCGLDTSPSLSTGPYTIWHRDLVTALIFHVATLMPSDPNDPSSMYKKAHIGNDFVTVVYNASSRPWRFDTLPSAFNYVHIVVSPEARTSFIETRAAHDDAWFASRWFKVQIVTRADFPNLGSAAETKVVSGRALGLYVRNLVLNACIFAQVWSAREGGNALMGGSWQTRLRGLETLRERHGPKTEDKEKEKARK